MDKKMHQLWLVPLLVFLVPVIGLGWLLRPPPSEPLPPGMERTIDDAIQLLRDETLLGADKDWASLAREAHSLLKARPTLYRLDEVLGMLARAVGDPHTLYWTPQLTKQAMQAPAGPAPSLDPSRKPPVAYARWPIVVVEEHPFMDDERARQAILDIRQRTEAAIARSPCGLMLDLRTNYGGNMYPMLMGLAPLFPQQADERLMAFQSRKAPQMDISLNVVGSTLGKGWPAEAPLPANRYAGHVAVLLGSKTTSSGEMVAIAAQGQPGWRSFGQATAGYTTGNVPAGLANGGMLLLTTSRVLTREGRQVEGPLQPDSPTPGDPREAAAAWLNASCPVT